ncbi:hypothetical protein VNO77_15808 [Canavalia gladiata]|uniref:Uncharacterized protein n=1 Tax=Canavalia gladiata TaxID=3824 RepID=A0AAN9M4C9_CANGL
MYTKPTERNFPEPILHIQRQVHESDDNKEGGLKAAPSPALPLKVSLSLLLHHQRSPRALPREVHARPQRPLNHKNPIVNPHIVAICIRSPFSQAAAAIVIMSLIPLFISSSSLA